MFSYCKNIAREIPGPCCLVIMDKRFSKRYIYIYIYIYIYVYIYIYIYLSSSGVTEL